MSNSNYTVSALKYRPKSWDTIIGQENIATTLQQAIDSNQLAQAYFAVQGVLEKHLQLDYLQSLLI